MKIMLVDVNCKVGSTGKIVYDLHSAYSKSGFDSVVCYGRGPKINEKNIFKFGIDVETYIHAFLTRLTGLTGCFSPLSTYRLIKFIKKFNPDIVHIHELHAYFVNIGTVMRFFKKNKIKTIWTFHCEFMYTGKCGYSYDCNLWETECSNCPQIREYPKSLFFDFSTNMHRKKKAYFDGYNHLTVVSPSEWLDQRIAKSFLSNKKHIVINNGIDTSIFRPRNYEILQKKHNIIDERIVLAVAPNIMDERKGGKWIVELAEKLASENIKIIMIGVDDLSVKFPNNVIAIGRTSDQVELARYYTFADLFVICSKIENFPTTCVEALCCGTPVVGFDTGGTKETANNLRGEFVEYGELDKLADLIKLKLSKGSKEKDKTLYSDYAIKLYDKNVMVKKYSELIDNIIIR